jgi:hypothetical protein
MANYNHPAYSRYPHLKNKSIAGDYINSEDNLRTTDWKKTFAFTPKITITGNKVWFKTIYKRKRWLHIEPPQFPVNSFNKTEYAEWEEILNLKMR